MTFKDKVALVTGASSGIGLATAVSVVYPYMTLTDFEKNTIKETEDIQDETEEDGGKRPPPDTVDYIAGRILEGMEDNEAEIFAHDWMKKLKQR